MNVSNETLLIDIKNTEKEILAYNKLAEGFELLSELPEFNQYKKKDYAEKSINYENLAEGCMQFLDQLLSIKAERNL